MMESCRVDRHDVVVFSTGFDHWMGGLSEVPTKVTNMPKPQRGVNRNAAFAILVTRGVSWE